MEFSVFNSLVLYVVSFTLASFLLTTGNLGPKKSKALICIALLIPIALGMFRHRVGTDYPVYLWDFTNIKNTPWQHIFSDVAGVEYGYNLFVKILTFFGSERVYFGATAAITVVFVYYAINKQYTKASLGLAFFLYLLLQYTISFNAVRQFMAVSVIFWGYRYVFEKNAFKYFLTVTLAMLFCHSSAMIAFPAYFLWDKERNTINKNVAIVGVTAVVAFLFTFQSVFEQMSQMSDSMARYSAYGETDSGGKNRDLLLKIAVFAIIIPHIKYLVKLDPRNGLLILFMFISILIGTTGYKSPFVKRMAIYFEIVAIVLLPQLIHLYAAYNKPLIRFVMVLYGIGVFTLIFFILRQAYIIPYRCTFF